MTRLESLMNEVRMAPLALSRLTGIPLRSAYRYARGEGIPKYNDAVTIANIFNVSIEDLWGDDGPIEEEL